MVGYSIETVFHSLSFSVRKPLLKTSAAHSAAIKKALTNKKPCDSLNCIYSAQMFVQSLSFDVQTTGEPQTTLHCGCSAHVHLNTAVSVALALHNGKVLASNPSLCHMDARN